MENIKTPWSQVKVLKHHKVGSVLLILSGIYSLYLSLDGIIMLGARLSAFVFPYLFNYFAFFLSLFQIYTAICFLNKQNWAKKAIILILIIRVFMGYYDMEELLPSIFILPYLLYIIPSGRIGTLFEKENTDQRV
ncbi:MAG: hypothetical protein KKD05_10885 [Candidatus Omnitrophica bacterium]|nr:hypothetical protein [Candidatus Omnitrophota bacterium]